MTDATTAPRLVYISVPDRPLADRLAHGLVEARLAACVNIIPQMLSVYRWEGVVEIADELQLVIKTTADAVPALTAWVMKEHPYTVPSIIALPIDGGNPDYIKWIGDNVG